MATTSVSVSVAPPPSPPPKASRRVPFGVVANAENRIFESVQSTTTMVKQARSVQSTQSTHAAQPKKQIVESQQMPQTPAKSKRHVASLMPPPRKATNRTRIVGRSPPPNPPNISVKQQNYYQEQRQHQLSQRRQNQLSQQQQQQQQQPQEQPEQQAQQNAATMLAWQRHYRKQFPKFVIYFDSIPDDVAAKTQRDIARLGARIERFFSRVVTHIITTRQIPPEGAVSSTAPLVRSSAATQTTCASATHAREPLLSKHEIAFKTAQGLCRTRGLETKTIIHEDPPEVQRKPRGPSDILLRAREHGMKIWALEKLHRIMSAIFDNNAGSQMATNKYSQQHADTAAAPDAELSHLLRKERLHGPMDRDPNTMSKDMVVFKGPFLYIRDMKSSNRPIMVRDYQPVVRREDGDWPQFRSSASGKCPFVDDYAQQREKRIQEETVRIREARAALARKRAREDNENQAKTAMDPPRGVKRPRTLSELNPLENRPNFGRQSAVPAATTGRRLAEMITAKRQAPHEIMNEMAFTSHNTNTKSKQYLNSKFAYEPAASGVQPSKLTSAIRSQCVSSHVDVPGVKAGMSKDMFELQRKVAGNLMERRPSCLQPEEITTRENETAINPYENSAVTQKEGVNTKAQPAVTGKIGEASFNKATLQPPKIREKNTEVERKDRSGYCENCREKFNDFDRHTASRRHQRFAMHDENFAELDALLAQIRRPLRRKISK